MSDDGNPGKRHFLSPYVRNSDLWLIVLISLFATLLLCLFVGLLYWAGFLDFMPPDQQSLRGNELRYFQDALDYREKRLTLALLLRSFLTGFSFIVGLALCTQGGVFILRQVSAFTEISVNPNGKDSIPDGDIEKLKRGRMFSFESYSPGVVFLLGGVTLMVATQHLALPIKWSEIVLPGAMQQCFDEAAQKWGSCLESAGMAASAPPTAAQKDICDVPGNNLQLCNESK